MDHVIESNRSAGLVEAVNRHVVEAHAHTVNGTRTSPDILTQPEAEGKNQPPRETKSESDFCLPSRLNSYSRTQLEFKLFFSIERTKPKTPQKTNQKSKVAADEFDPSKLSLRDRVKLFDRPLSVAGPASALPPKRPSRKVVARFLTQPVTSREVRKALHLGWTRGGGPSTAKPAIPTIG